MKVVVVHPHFRRGGVTRVVENASRALAERGVDVLALSGETYPGDALSAHREIEGLGYDPEIHSDRGVGLAKRLRGAAREFFGGDPDIWHVHNHSLGKNATLPAALRHLAEGGARLLLQVHDFAEDGRPENYTVLRRAYPDPASFSRAVYPDSPQVHYAVLNGRDAAILRRAGVADARCHLLPNPVAVPRLEERGTRPLPEAERLILYPTRGIRRKNLGELLMHAAHAPAGTLFATTLRPENPVWQAVHDAWERAARRRRLPIRFGLAAEHAFDDLIGRADAFITTSVAEGFGLAFLEPALFDQPLIGRNLPGITRDFEAWGVRLDHLYDRLPVPPGWIDAAAVRRAVEAALERLGRAYRHPFPGDAADRALAAMRTADGGWDFGRLDEELQTAALEAALKDPGRLRPFFQQAQALSTPEQVARQRQAVESHLNLGAYGARLHRLYDELVSTLREAPGALDAAAILAAFLDPASMSLLRS